MQSAKNASTPGTKRARMENRGWSIARECLRHPPSSILHPRVSSSPLGVLGALAFLALCVSLPARATPKDPNAAYLLHLPGIAGYRWLDKQMIAGLQEGGYRGRVAVHNWPGEQAGLGALLGRERNDRHAQQVADALEKRYRESPGRRIVLTAHSGGAGILVWALEKLPADVRVDTVVLLAPALSPGYDLTDALRHVRGTMYAFTSTLDSVVLGVGTRTFGTIDGVKCDAAGMCGFAVPEQGDASEYSKLVQMPYDVAWMREGNLGDHIGPMRRQFSANILAPIVMGKEMKPATRPTPGRRAAAGPPDQNETTESTEAQGTQGKK
jgi:hypothetical protein